MERRVVDSWLYLVKRHSIAGMPSISAIRLPNRGGLRLLRLSRFPSVRPGRTASYRRIAVCAAGLTPDLADAGIVTRQGGRRDGFCNEGARAVSPTRGDDRDIRGNAVLPPAGAGHPRARVLLESYPARGWVPFSASRGGFLRGNREATGNT